MAEELDYATRGERTGWQRFFLLLGLVIIGVPYIWITLTAFKLRVDAAAVPPVLISPVTLDNFREVLDGPYLRSLLNTAIVTITTTVATLVIGVPAGYGFAKGRFAGRFLLGGWLLVSRMMPPVIFIIPLFVYFQRLGLINTFTGLTLAYMTGLLPFTVWMMAAYFGDVPEELEEAARVDGASRSQVFRRVSLPLVVPGIATVGLLIAIASLGEYFIPFILAGVDTTPASVGVVNYVGVNSINWGAMAAASLTLIVPVFILTILSQKGLLRGLTAGAVKG